MKPISSHRPERIADSILRTLSQLLIEELRDSRLRHVTLVQVRMTSDLREARVYYDFAGSLEKRQAVEQALAKASGFMRRRLAAQLTLKVTPHLKFHFDETRELYDRADQILHDIDPH